MWKPLPKQVPIRRSRRHQFFIFLLNFWVMLPHLAIAQNAAQQASAVGKGSQATAQVSPENTVNQASNPSPQKPDYSKEGVIVEHLITKVAFENDGTGTRETAVVSHIQSQAGVQSLAVLTFAYLSSNENVEFDYIRVRKPDGSVVTTPDYNVQDMPADVTRSAPMYSDIHEKHVTVKGLGVGDDLEYVVRYRIFKPQVPGKFWFEYTFAEDLVARDHELLLTVPRDKYVKVVSPDFKPEIKDDGAHRIYVWKTANLIRKEKITPVREAPLPSVQITTFRSWDEVGHWYDELQRPELAVTPQLQARAAELTKGLTSEDEKIRALYDYVSTHFHYVSLSFGIGRYQPHAATTSSKTNMAIARTNTPSWLRC